jgi:hypothetical protein
MNSTWPRSGLDLREAIRQVRVPTAGCVQEPGCEGPVLNVPSTGVTTSGPGAFQTRSSVNGNPGLLPSARVPEAGVNVKMVRTPAGTTSVTLPLAGPEVSPRRVCKANVPLKRDGPKNAAHMSTAMWTGPVAGPPATSISNSLRIRKSEPNASQVGSTWDTCVPSAGPASCFHTPRASDGAAAPAAPKPVTKAVAQTKAVLAMMRNERARLNSIFRGGVLHARV